MSAHVHVSSAHVCVLAVRVRACARAVCARVHVYELRVRACVSRAHVLAMIIHYLL